MLQQIYCLLALFLLTLFCQAVATSEPWRGSTRQNRPNIIFVLSDDIGYPDIGYNGGAGQALKTPVMDSLARNGIILDNYYAQFGCTPSRSALMTGRYPIHTGLQSRNFQAPQPHGLNLNFTLLPEQLQKYGYDTHMIGKWHIGMYQEEYLPQNRGFDTFFGHLQGRIDYFSHINTPIDRSTGIQYPGLDFWNGTTPVPNKDGVYSSLVFMEEAIRVIKEKDENSPPMYMYVALQNGHAPYQVPESYTKQYSYIDNANRRALAGQITMLDEAVANITSALKSRGLWENTIFVYSGDNGAPTAAENSVGTNYPLRGQKGTVWEGGCRVAGFISGPKAPRHRTVYNGLMHISDWYPTLLHAAGIKIPDGLDGINQWKALQGTRKSSPRNEMVYNINPLRPLSGVRKEGSPFDNRIHAGLRIGDMKLVTGDPSSGGRYPPVFNDAQAAATRAAREADDEILDNLAPEDVQNIHLFNVKEDPYEITDLSQSLPGTVNEMLARLAVLLEGSVEPSDVPGEFVKADPGLRGDVWWPWLDMEGNLINLVESSS